MILKPGEVCKFREKCSYVGSGVNECFGLRSNRDNYFRCSIVNEVKQIENYKKSKIK